MTNPIETTQRLGDIRVIESPPAIYIAFTQRSRSPSLSPTEARALARMLNAAARRVEGRRQELLDNLGLDVRQRPNFIVGESLSHLPAGTYDVTITDLENGDFVMERADP